MSYYSEVAIACYEKDAEALFEKLRGNDLLSHADVLQDDNNPDVVVIYWEVVQWSTTSDNVASIIAELKHIPHRILRVGEGPGDVWDETNNAEHDAFDLHTRISIATSGYHFADNWAKF